jgi:putative PEP-CTERM system TPR-repeat lipoprotein
MTRTRALRLATVVAVLVLSACGKSPDALLAAARTAAEQGDYRTAGIQLRSILRDEPANLPAVLLLAEVAAAGGNPELAERNYRRAVELGADPAGFWQPWVDQLIVLGRFDDALARLDATPVAAADRPAALLRRGRALRGLGRASDAEAVFREAAGLAPGLAAAQVELAGLLLTAGREPEAVTAVEAALAADPKDPDALLLQAGRLLAGPEPATAAPVLEAALAAATERRYGPGRAAALGYLAELDLAAGRTEAAAARVEDLRKQVGPAPIVRYLRARVALDQGDVKKSREQLQEALAADKTYLPARRLLGAIQVLENQFELAEMNLKPVVAANPDDFFARRLLATVLLARNRPAEALPLLDNLAVADDEARETLLAMMGQASLQVGDAGKAIDYVRQGSQQFPGNPLFELGLAMTLLAEGRTDEAEQVIRRVRGDEAEVTRAAFEAIALMQRGQPTEAVAAARSVAGRYPDAAWSQNLLGSVLLAAGEFADARVALLKAVTLDPDDSAALSNLARVEQLLNNTEAAIDAWRRILTADPANFEAGAWLARLEIERGNVPEALKILEPFRGRSSRAQLLVGAILLDRGEIERGRALGEQALAAEPDNPEALNLVGLAGLAGGQPKEAATSFRRAVELQPTRPIYRVNLARALLAANDLPAAQAAITEARKLDARSPQLLSLEIAVALARGAPADARAVLARMAAEGLGDARLRAALDGEVLIAEGKPGPASERYAEAYRLGPSFESASRAWRAALAAGRKADPALLDDWLARNPDDLQARRLTADLVFGAGLADRARTLYEEVLKAEPRNLTALNNLAWLYQEQGDERAVQLGERALKLAPDNAAVLDTAGWAQLRLGDRARGAALIADAARRAPADLDIQFHLAVSLLEGGEAAAGRELLAKLVAGDQPFASRADAEARLRQL